MTRLLATAAVVCALCRAEAVRPPAVAGEFYPADVKVLASTVDGFLAKAKSEPAAGVVAIVAPHAGYPYSGAVAGEAYASLRGRKFTRVIVIAPTHVEAFDFTSIYSGDAYETPLGKVLVDRAFASKLSKMHPSLRLSTKGHLKTKARGEHSLEVQLPFLQRLLGDFKLVPVVIGDQSYEKCRALGVALAKLIRDQETLIVASSDLSHYHSYADAVALDRRVLGAVEDWDYLSLSRNLESNIWEACGGGPIVAAMIAAERLGAAAPRVLKYANSGDVTGEKSRVVGYSAMAFNKGTSAARPSDSYSAEDRHELLRVARKSVQIAVEENKLAPAPPLASGVLTRGRGAFVTLKENGKLRGCVGNTSASKPLLLVVRDVAAFAAVRDPRFKPVTRDELPKLRYEVSVLSPLRRIADPEKVQPGLHGLLIRKGEMEGLLLPQIAVEENFDRKTFLDQVCRKAGLPPQSWRDPDADLFVFTADVISDSQP